MSYILEALRKMEKQRRQDRGEASWVETLTAKPEEEKGEIRGPVRRLVAASVFFGLAGIVAGSVLYFGSQGSEREPLPAVQERGPAAPPRTVPQAAPPPQAVQAPAREAAAPKPRPKPETRALTVSEIKAARIAREESGEGKPESASRQEKVIDLTGRYRLSAIGEVNHKKYATLDRNDYSVGDEFTGMVLTAIEQDRVHLKGKADGQKYVIRFGQR
jgi:hypothetical protein